MMTRRQRVLPRRPTLGYNYTPAFNAGVGVASHFLPAVGQVASKASGLVGGAAGLAMLTNPVTIGIEAATAAIPAVINLFKCGTIGQVGCQKRTDASVDENGRAAMRQVLYLVETGQLSQDAADAQMQQIASAMQQSYVRQENWNARTGPDYSCGAWLSQGPGCGQQVCPGTNIPPSSFAASFNCGTQYPSFAANIQALMNAVGQAAAMAPKAAAAAQPPAPVSVAPGSPIQASTPRTAQTVPAEASVATATTAPPSGAPPPPNSAPSKAKSLLPWILGAGAAALALTAL